MINPEKIIRMVLPYIVAVALFFVGRWAANKEHARVAVDVETVKQLHEAEIKNMRLDYELKIKTVEVEFIKQREAINNMSPGQIDSLWGEFGF